MGKYAQATIMLGAKLKPGWFFFRLTDTEPAWVREYASRCIEEEKRQRRRALGPIAMRRVIRYLGKALDKVLKVVGLRKKRITAQIIKAEFDRIEQRYFHDWKDSSEWSLGIGRIEFGCEGLTIRRCAYPMDKKAWLTAGGCVCPDDKEIWMNLPALESESLPYLDAAIIHELCHVVCPEEHIHGVNWCKRMQQVSIEAMDLEPDLSAHLHEMYVGWSWVIPIIETYEAYRKECNESI